MIDNADLVEQIRRWDAGQLPIRMETLIEAARRYVELTESGPIPARQCVFPLVEEELLVYPTDQRRSYGSQGDDE